MWSFVLWAWLNNATPLPPPPTFTTSQTSAGPGWRPRDLAELLAADSRLTLDQIRKLIQATKPEFSPVHRLARTLIPSLTVTPNLFTPEDEEEELIWMLTH